jgi:RNA polymerase sigma-70 factor (ECF subfamily)
MSEDTGFRDLIRRMRSGDSSAATELVRRYEPAIRLAVHVRLTDPGLRRVFDSMGICQSVLASFFLRAAAGQYELDSPTQLLKLLTTMARNKLLSHAQAQRTARRDYRRIVGEFADESQCPVAGPDPSQVAPDRELLLEWRARLSCAERVLADRRGRLFVEGHSRRGRWPAQRAPHAAGAGPGSGHERAAARGLLRALHGGIAEAHRSSVRAASPFVPPISICFVVARRYPS